MNTLLQDVRFAIRVMRKNYVFTLFAIVTLALGIGANTAIFSVASGVLLRALPFKEPERVVFVWINNARRKMAYDKLPAPPADYLDWRNQNNVFEEISAFYSNSFTLTGLSEPVRIEGVQATADFFHILGSHAAIGRTFGPGEDQPGSARVVVLSQGFWKRQFGGDPAVVGKKIILNGVSHEVIGVMPADFDFPQGNMMPSYLQFPARPELWTPLSFKDEIAKDRSTFNLATMARLKPGVTLPQAQANMTAISAAIDQEYRKGAGYATILVDMREQLVGDVRTALLVLLGAVGLVLLVACANVSNLQLSRSLKRQKELAVRSALGGGRGRLVRQILTESVLLALPGGVLGLLLAYWGTRLLLSISPDSLPRASEIGIDARVLVFSFAVTLVAGVISGLVPALQVSRTDLNTLLRDEARSSTASRRSRRTRDFLVVAEVGLALVLLIGAGLLVHSFVLLQQVKPGFRPDNVLTLHIDLPDDRYPEDRMNLAYFDQLLPRLATLPGIESVGLVSNLPLSGAAMSTTFNIDGRPAASPQDRPGADYTIASPGFFAALGIRAVRGRQFGDEDTATSPGVVIINEAMAKRFWPGEDPLGRTISVSVGKYKGQRQIVGVVADVRLTSLTDQPRPEMYVPYAQHPDGFMFMVARTSSNPLAFAPVIRREVLALDKDQPITEVRSMEQVVSESQNRRRFNLILLSLFAGLAVVLTVVGVYGVVSYSITQRVHEIGVRTALGARPFQIVRLIVRQGMLPALLGIAIGLFGAFALTRMMASLLYQVSPTDPVVFVIAAATLTTVAFLAIYIPAQRATKIDPVRALREE
jgi:putative ABC transport system permease protein